MYCISGYLSTWEMELDGALHHQDFISMLALYRRSIKVPFDT